MPLTLDPNSIRALVILAAAVAAVSMTITMSKIFLPLRTWIKSKSPFLGDLFACPYCFSHWGSLIAVLVWYVRPIHTEAWLLDYLVAIFAMVTVASWWVHVIYLAYKR